MPIPTKPYDGAFTTFNYGDTPGAGDFDRLQNDSLFLSSTPNAKLGRSTDQLINNGGAFTSIQWSQTLQSTDAADMVIYASGFTDRIRLPYVGDWEVGCVLRTQYNSPGGGAFAAAELQLSKTYTSGHADVLIDQDIQPIPTSITVPLNLRVHTITQVIAGDIAGAPALRAQFSQLSGGIASVKAVGAGGAFCYPIMWARWMGTSAV